jgi:glycosyltransferase involved in cell wall biosynthesis
MEKAPFVRSKNVNFYNLRGDQSDNAPIKTKIIRVLKYYFNLIKYTAETESTIFHINWLNKFILFDRIILNIYYKCLGKKIVYTAHDINFSDLVGNSSLFDQLSLAFMYRFVDHIIVHTNKMKSQLIADFNINVNKVTVIPFGINNILPKSELTTAQARRRLHLENEHKVLLFFGNIAPYKGLESLIQALVYLKDWSGDFKLIIAGRVKQNCQRYMEDIERLIEQHDLTENVLKRIEFIPDKDMAAYFKGADVLILPYKNIFQSGLIFTAYSFGLPVVASDVGSLKEDIVEGKTGFVCKPEDPRDLADKIILYFQSDLFENLTATRTEIIKYANEKFSWETSGKRTCDVYKRIISNSKICH